MLPYYISEDTSVPKTDKFLKQRFSPRLSLLKKKIKLILDRKFYKNIFASNN